MLECFCLKVRNLIDLKFIVFCYSGKFSPKIEEFEEALEEAQNILKELEDHQLEYNVDEVRENQLARAEKCLSDVQAVKNRLEKETANVDALRNKLSDLDSRIADLNDNINKVGKQIDEINELNQHNR